MRQAFFLVALALAIGCDNPVAPPVRCQSSTQKLPTDTTVQRVPVLIVTTTVCAAVAP